MQTATALIVPLIMTAIIISGIRSRTDIFGVFTDGAKGGLVTMFGIAPTLIGLVTAIGMFKASGALGLLTQLFTPIAEFLGIPHEVLPLFMLKPISGSGSLAMLNQIVHDVGADSPISRAAAIMAGSTETTFYCIAIYFGSIKIKKTGYTVPCALFGDFVGMMTAILTVSFKI
ncbi:MAG: spore maturation protein [Lachnospiraceae bacterium]|nr:spore maturation protein [Lachnospiraceae bacterium]